MKIIHAFLATSALALGLTTAALAQEKTLHLLTWADYAPADVVAQFEKESGYKVALTLYGVEMPTRAHLAEAMVENVA